MTDDKGKRDQKIVLRWIFRIVYAGVVMALTVQILTGM